MKTLGVWAGRYDRHDDLPFDFAQGRLGALYEKNVSTAVETSYYFAGGARIAMKQGGVLYYFAADHLGSISLTMGPSGNTTMGYKPFGETRYGNTPTDRRFTGQRSEEATLGSLYDYGARFYSPYLNRWIQPDTIVPDPKNPQSLNRYSYVSNNPVKYTDPTGHMGCDVCNDGGGEIGSGEGGSGEGGGGDEDGGGIAPGGAGCGGGACGDPHDLHNDAVVTQARREFVQQVEENATDALKNLTGDTTGTSGDSTSSDASNILPDDAIVCRGGLCTADRFETGTGVKVEPDGTLSGVSATSADGKSVEDLSSRYENRKVGVTTVGDIREAGGTIEPNGSLDNPYHCTICGLTAQQLVNIFQVIANPNHP